MELFFIIVIIAVISIALAVRSLIQLNRNLHEVEVVSRSLRHGKIVFHAESHSTLSSESSEDK